MNSHFWEYRFSQIWLRWSQNDDFNAPVNMPTQSIQNSQRDCHVYLIEDDEGLRMQLAGTLEDSGLTVKQFSTAESFLVGGVTHSPAVIVTDMVLPGVSGINLFEAVRAAGMKTPLIFISGYSEPNQIISGMKLGAVDFLWKPFKSEALLKAVVQSLVLDMQQNMESARRQHVDFRWKTLTDREREVCKLMLAGFGNTAVAEKLNIQPDTANKHRMKVLAKMDVKERPELVELLKDFEPAQS